MNILLIIFDNNINNKEVFKDRISSLGDTMYIYDNIVFVETEYNTEEAYNKLSANEFDKELILILYVKDELYGFWGRMKTELWTWLDTKAENVKDGYVNSQISMLNYQIQTLIKENEELKKQIENNES